MLRSNGLWGAGSCFHSSRGPNPWWQVDLGSTYSIAEFKIFHRTDCCQDRLVSTRVVISDTDDYRSGRHCYELGHVITVTDEYDGILGAGESGSCDGLTGERLHTICWLVAATMLTTSFIT